MEAESLTIPPAAPVFQPRQVYAMAAVCLIAGLGIGYLLRVSRSEQTLAPARPIATATAAHPTETSRDGKPVPTMGDMKNMADRQAAPLMEKLRADPKNMDLLGQVAAIYYTTHQFGDAEVFYARQLLVQPRNVAVRTKLASSLFYEGKPDAAIAQLNRALTDDPKDANALFNLGVVLVEGQGDAKGAVAIWQKLLKTNPQLAPDRKATVQKLILQAQAMESAKPGRKGAPTNGGHE